MITYTTATTDQDLQGILDLQKVNLANNLTDDEIKSEGFVTVVHSYDVLKSLNDIENHVIAKDGSKVIAYLLAMTAESRHAIPILYSLFDAFEKVVFAGKPISNYRYILVGQVCVAKGYRGKGILDNAYSCYRKQFETKYDFAVTEIASSNKRSINAHKRIGFREIFSYHDPNAEWEIVLWDWNNKTT